MLGDSSLQTSHILTCFVSRGTDCLPSGYCVNVAHRKALESRDSVYLLSKGQVCLLSSIVKAMLPSRTNVSSFHYIRFRFLKLRVPSPSQAPLNAMHVSPDSPSITPWELGLRELAQMLILQLLPLL